MTVEVFPRDLQARIAHLPADTALPIVRAAAAGTPFFFPDAAAAEATFPGCAELYAAAAPRPPPSCRCAPSDRSSAPCR